MRHVFGFIKLILFMAIGSLSTAVILNPAANARTIAILAGLIGFAMVFNGLSLDNLNLAETLKRDFKLVELQNFILTEIKKNNTQVISLIVSQADLLTKMTSVAMGQKYSLPEHAPGEPMVELMRDGKVVRETISKSKEAK